MRPVTTFLIATCWTLLTTPSPGEKLNPQSGAVCEHAPSDMRAVHQQAQSGDPAAEYDLALSMLHDKPSDTELAAALPWFQSSAEQGYAAAQYMYGSLFRSGRWRDPQQMVYWWSKAAEQGETRAQLWLGLAYLDGRDGVERDRSKALRLLLSAARQGQPDAQFSVGQMYEDGEGVAPNHDVAATWYRRAANHVPDLGGAGQALDALERFHRERQSSAKDYVFLYVWHALNQDPDGMRNLASKMTSTQLQDAQRITKAWFTAPVCPREETNRLNESAAYQ